MGGVTTAANSVVERRTRRVVWVTLSRVELTIPAIDAPVSSIRPASIRNVKMRCAPKVEKSVFDDQYIASPVAPPCSRK